MRRRQRDLALALTAFIVALILWQVEALYWLMVPFRLFVTMIHELGHGLAAELTGGEFVRFEVTRRGAGLAYTRGGVPFIVIQAGYLGTALFGAGLLVLVHRVRQPGHVAVGLGLFLGILSLAYAGLRPTSLSALQVAVVGAAGLAAVYLILTRETNDGRLAGAGLAALAGMLFAQFAGDGSLLTVLVGSGSALALVALGLRAGRDVIRLVLTFLAFLTGLQAISDAWVLLRLVTLPGTLLPLNDASAMARQVGGPAAAWALLWVLSDIAMMGTAIYQTFRQ
ncbi:MAG: hypothetical protein Kow00106_15100 [Anaerolineae bacterium]